MPNRERVINGLNDIGGFVAGRMGFEQARNFLRTIDDAVELLKEQGRKQITVHKKHVITWSQSDEFSMRKLYEAICETLLDEGELFIAQTDDHKAEFVFYVAESR